MTPRASRSWTGTSWEPESSTRTGRTEREKTVVIGYAFDPATPPDPADFYNALGIHAADTEGSDIFMIRKDGELLLKAVTEKGEDLLKELAVLEDGLGAG